MNILVVYQYFGTPAGSWSTRIYEFTKRWVLNGNLVTVITAPYEKSDIKADGFISRQMINGINLIVINSTDSNRDSVLKRAFNAFLFAFMSVYYALKLDYDVLLASSGPITVCIPMIMAKKLRKKSTVFEVRDLWPAGGIEMGKIKKNWQKKLAKWFEKKCYKNADLIVTASRGQKENIHNRYPELNIKVIPQASDIDLFGWENEEWKRPAWSKGKNVFTHIGSLGFIHNVGFIIESAEYVETNYPDSDILFVLVGEGAERLELEKMVQQSGLENVKFTGLLPKTEVVNWVHASVATLFTTLDNSVQNTSSPNKIFDSFAAGKPIIQTTTGWIKDLVEENNCGINIKPGDIHGFAEAVYKLADSNGEAERMGVNARKLAEGEFNRDKLAKEYLEAIESIV